MKVFANNDYKKVLSDILNYYYSKVKGDYIPAIINEGNLFSTEGFENNDLYMKIIAVKNGVKVNKSWLLENLSSYKSEECFNYIVEYKYLRNRINGIHPDLLTNLEVSFCKQDNDSIMSLEYIDSKHKINGDRILISDKNNIFILFPFIKEYTDKRRFAFDDCDFDLYVEIEYRTYDDNLKPKRLGCFPIKDGFVEISHEETAAMVPDDNKKLYWFKATVKLDTDRLVDSKELKDNRFAVGVVDFETRTIRQLNPDNFDDDMHAGLIVFSNEAIDHIKEYYYFYDLYLTPKNDGVESCLIDVLDDFVVFWEGEFNSKLPHELKQEIAKYNLTNITEHLISEPMFQSQLMAQWDVYKYFLPNQKLARKIKENYREKAFEQGLDFYPPRTIEEYSSFVKKVFAISGLSIMGLNISSQNKVLLAKIVDCDYSFETHDKMYANYQGLCLLFLKELGFDSEKE